MEVTLEKNPISQIFKWLSIPNIEDCQRKRNQIEKFTVHGKVAIINYLITPAAFKQLKWDTYINHPFKKIKVMYWVLALRGRTQSQSPKLFFPQGSMRRLLFILSVQYFNE